MHTVETRGGAAVMLTTLRLKCAIASVEFGKTKKKMNS